MTTMFPLLQQDLGVPDTLALLVGENPLPNYVAAQLIAGPQTKIWLFYSDGTTEEMQTLRRMLAAKEFAQIESAQLHESNPDKIRMEVSNKLSHANGTNHIHYTGGTKAMAVHAMRACSDRPIFSSYLDARHLKLWVEGPGITGVHVINNVGLHVPVTIREVLDLHNIGILGDLRSTPLWPTAHTALAHIHADQTEAKGWRDWCKKTLRRPDPDQHKFLANGKLNALETEDIPIAVRQALANDIKTILPKTFGELCKLAPKGTGVKKGEDLARWFDGGWMEDYTLAQLHGSTAARQINDTAISINAILESGSSETFEFDVAAMHGYRLFAISCTTSDDKKLCKSKLLEAVVRARQLGGAEARIGLVCCSDDPQVLEEQVQKLTQSQQLKVFGRADLLNLGEQLDQWITHVNEE
ncbi:MAG: hypothetical protein Fur005_42480 [Roseiflexaceae bacterium]